MKINIFFFSKWKWKADALIQTLYYKRAGPGQKKRNSFSRCARGARPRLPRPITNATLFFCHLTTVLYLRLATPKIPPPPSPHTHTPRRGGERVRREETKTLQRDDGVRPGWVRKKSSQRYYFIFRPFPPPHSPGRRTASQPFIGRLGNLQTLKRTKGNDGFLTPARTRVVTVGVGSGGLVKAIAAVRETKKKKAK